MTTRLGVAWVAPATKKLSRLSHVTMVALLTFAGIVFVTACGYIGYEAYTHGFFAKIEQTLLPGTIEAGEKPIRQYTSDPERPPQFVILSFDGSYSLDMWDETLDFAQDARRRNAPVDFTYFISGVYFLAEKNASAYQAPWHAAGQSAIGFADSVTDVELRVDRINRALRENHEIGSHANGHFDGSLWSKDDWLTEHAEFNDLLFNIQNNNPGLAKKYLALNGSDIVGFRAPELGVGPGAFDALKELGYRYDASTASDQLQWPKRGADDDIWRYTLSTVALGEKKIPVLAMDYNHYSYQSGVKDVAVRNSPTWRKFHQDLYEAYMNYFGNHYEHNRAPVIIANHFSKWNDGLYWEVMQRFALSVCGQPEVYCVSFKEVTDYMDSLGPEQLEKFQRGDFPKMEIR